MKIGLYASLNRIRSFGNWFVGFLGILVLMPVLCGFVPGFWIADLCSQFRLVYGGLSLLGLLGAILLRSPILIGLWLSVCCINSVPIISQFASPVGAGIQPISLESKTQAISVKFLNFNTEFQHNDDYSSFAKVASSYDPDVIALVEVNERWINSIEKTTRVYPYRKIELTGPGMAVFSKFPIEQCDVRCFGRSHHPRILVKLRVGKNALHVFVVHPTTPKTEQAWIERNSEFEMIAREIKLVPGAKVLIGDFNCGPWAPPFYDFLRLGLVDSEQGLGPQPSWPARPGRVSELLPIPPVIPIDHALSSADCTVLQRRLGPHINSDHLPVFVQYSLRR